MNQFRCPGRNASGSKCGRVLLVVAPRADAVPVVAGHTISVKCPRCHALTHIKVTDLPRLTTAA